LQAIKSYQPSFKAARGSIGHALRSAASGRMRLTTIHDSIESAM
jgi:hypothetical protein